MKRTDHAAMAQMAGTQLGGKVFRPLLLFSLALSFCAGCNRPNHKVEAGPFTSLGSIMAAQTSQLCQSKGNLVLLLSEADSRNLDSAGGQAADAFRKALPKSMPVVATEVVTVPRTHFSGSEPLPAAKFQQLMQKHVDADVLVSFVGVPRLTPQQMAQLPSPRPKVVAVEVFMFNRPTQALFAQNVVFLAALPKPGADDGFKPRSAQEWFDARYDLITPETAGMLP